MRLYEYEAKRILKAEGIPVPLSLLIRESGDAERGSALLPGLLKVQTLEGGRAKRGGVLPIDDLPSLRKGISRFLGQRFGNHGVSHLLLEQRAEIERELFAGMTYDAAAKCPIFLFSDQGGVDLEETAARTPESVRRLPLKPEQQANPVETSRWVHGLNLCANAKSLQRLTQITAAMVALFRKYDLILFEINPLALCASGEVLALDCRMEVDDDALFRFPNQTFIDRGRQGSRTLSAFERKAREIDEMDHRGVAGRMIEFPGNLGLLIGGGGASLTVFDAIRKHGGKPANYCEVGGNPTAQKVKAITRLLVDRPNVRKLAVIMNVVNNTRADLVAEGVLEGIREGGRDPREMIVVFRLPGSGEEHCKQLLEQSGVTFSGRELSIDQAAALAAERATG